MSESFSISEPSELTLFTGASALASCSDSADGVQVLTWSGGTGDVNWSMEDDGEYELDGGPSTLVLNTLAPGSYTVYASDVNFCTASISFEVAGPEAIVIEPMVTLASCTGSDDATIMVTSTGGAGSITYAFGCEGDYTSQDFFGPFAPGMYTICAQDANGCSASVEVEVVDQTPVTATFNVSNIACFGDTDASFEVIAEGGVGGYSYSLDGVEFTTDPMFVDAMVGLYSVIILDANNCLVEYIDAFEIMEPMALEASVATTNVDCFGDATGSIVISATGGTEPYTYSIGGFSQPSNTFNDVEAGSYTVTVVDDHGCEYSENVTISGPASALSVVVDGFGGEDGDGGFIDVTATGGTPSYEYDWTGTGGFTSPNEDLTGLSAGTYSLTVTDANGCEASITSDVIITGVGELSNQVALTLNPNPTRENVVLTLSGLTGDKLSYTVVDTQGRTVVSKELGNVNGVRIETINLSEVASGVYYVNVTIDGNVSIMKLIKQ
jgi:SprB repeat/Secretion system C-terminal sorting domain